MGVWVCVGVCGCVWVCVGGRGRKVKAEFQENFCSYTQSMHPLKFNKNVRNAIVIFLLSILWKEGREAHY